MGLIAILIGMIIGYYIDVVVSYIYKINKK